jgi:hypothetical protein
LEILTSQKNKTERHTASEAKNMTLHAATSLIVQTAPTALTVSCLAIPTVVGSDDGCGCGQGVPDTGDILVILVVTG